MSASGYREVWSHVDHFAARKVSVLDRLLGDLPEGARLLDLGCGIGAAASRLGSRFRVIGVDANARDVREAPPGIGRAIARGEELPFASGSFAAGYLFGVLHHVPLAQRAALLKEVARVLKPGGRLIVWEHNPINPVTRRVVRDCPIDHDAVLLGAEEGIALVRDAGLTLLKRRFVTFFPPALGALAPLERALGWLPLGAQYYVLAGKSE